MGGVHISRVGELLRCSELHRGWGAGKPRLRAEYKHAVKSRWKTGGLQNGRGPYKPRRRVAPVQRIASWLGRRKAPTKSRI